MISAAPYEARSTGRRGYQFFLERSGRTKPQRPLRFPRLANNARKSRPTVE
jgi:hypothetical protein